MTPEPTCAPNHHAHHPGFAGVGGLVAAATMVFGRSSNARLAVELSRLQPDDVVVDIGCGPGAAARYAARRGAAVTGVDPAPVMLRVARMLTRSARVRYVDGSAEQLPLSDGAATVAWTIACVHHWSDVDAGLSEAYRVLRAGGRFVAIEKQREAGGRGLATHGWTLEQATRFAEMSARVGFGDPNVAAHDAGRHPVLSVTAVRR